MSRGAIYCVIEPGSVSDHRGRQRFVLLWFDGYHASVGERGPDEQPVTGKRCQYFHGEVAEYRKNYEAAGRPFTLASEAEARAALDEEERAFARLSPMYLWKTRAGPARKL